MEFDKSRKTVFSGIQPSGEFSIGNYFGALKHWAAMQEGVNPIYCIVDMHAITVPQDPETLRRRTLECAAVLLAIGIDPDKSLLFIQSHASAHAELAWILNCFSYMGELSRMTQFKDKSQKLNAESIRVGLFDYPVLMAADILAYQTDIVPVGEDQRQHIELTRDIAVRFNQAFGDTFTVPEGRYAEIGTKVLSLSDPSKKMSKSDENRNSYVLILEEPESILNKFKRAVTDSEPEIRYDPKAKPGISNLLEIYAAASGISVQDSVSQFDGLGYGELKKRVGEAVIEELRPIQEKYAEFSKDKAYVDSVLKAGADAAREIAASNLKIVQEKVGFYSL
ncbi:MAG: tryptophan--tRNA ligase [Eubacteriaceae bacterium]|nr:tryptophan--tRNA ligase [Eubacteriaceae bacterium]